MKIIGISGKAGAGKDTLAQMLVLELYRYGECKTIHFADVLKTAASKATGIPRSTFDTQEGKASEIKWLGMTVRELLQKFGTAIREGVDPDFWVKSLFNIYEDKDFIIIPDVRFPNEAKAIKDRGGILIRIERDGAGAGNHISETALDDYKEWDYVINNNKSLEELKKMGKNILGLKGILK